MHYFQGFYDKFINENSSWFIIFILASVLLIEKIVNHKICFLALSQKLMNGSLYSGLENTKSMLILIPGHSSWSVRNFSLSISLSSFLISLWLRIGFPKTKNVPLGLFSKMRFYATLLIHMIELSLTLQIGTQCNRRFGTWIISAFNYWYFNVDY